MVFRQIVAIAFLLNCALNFSNAHTSSLYDYPLETPQYRDEPLFLTPLLQHGNLQQARNMALVKHKEFGNLESYSGYFTINKEYDSNTFFWFFPAEVKSEKAPVLLWLTGRPGQSSLYDLFLDNGPLQVTPAKTVTRRQESWAKTHNVLYIDSPVASGYSFTKHSNGLASSEQQVGTDVLVAVIQFFSLFPELRHNAFFLGGKSFGAKQVTHVAHAITEYNSGRVEKINLKGLVIANGLIDPENQLVYSDYLYQMGLIDSNGKAKLHKLEGDIQYHIKNQDYATANRLITNIYTNTETKSIVGEYTGFEYFDNALFTTSKYDKKSVTELVQRSDYRAALHVGNIDFTTDGSAVIDSLANDLSQSVADLFGKLILHYKVLVFNGQFNMKIPYTSAENFIRKLQWPGAVEYKYASRQQWWVGKELAGYTKTVKNLTEAMVRNSGHSVAADQPKWSLDLVTKFTRNIPFSSGISRNQ